MKRILKLGLIGMLSIFFLASPSFAKDLDNYDVTFYQDSNANYSLALLKPNNKSIAFQENVMLLIHDDRYLRLDPAYLGDTGLPIEPILPGNYQFSLEYDPSTNVINGEMEWLLSPDGSWGFFITNPILVPNSSKPLLFRTCLFKNMETGRIEREISTWGIHSPLSYYWLPDNTFLYCRYSPEENQNIIAVYDPAATHDNPMTAFPEIEDIIFASYKNKKLLNGTILSYDRDTNEVTFVKNELERRKYLLNLTTMKEVPTEDYIKNFKHSDYTMAPSLYIPPGIHLPQDLDISNLPVISPKVDFKYQQLLQVGGNEIPLPMAYYDFPRSKQPSIPLRQLINHYGVSFSTNFNKIFKTISITASNGNQIGTWTSEAICPPVLIGTAEEIGSNIYIYSELFFHGLEKATGVPVGDWQVIPLYASNGKTIIGDFKMFAIEEVKLITAEEAN